MIALNYSGKSRFEINAGPIHLAVIPDIYLTGAMKGNWQFTLEVLEINFQKDGFLGTQMIRSYRLSDFKTCEKLPDYLSPRPELRIHGTPKVSVQGRKNHVQW